MIKACKPLNKVDVSHRTIHDPLVQQLVSRGWHFKVTAAKVLLVKELT